MLYWDFDSKFELRIVSLIKKLLGKDSQKSKKKKIRNDFKKKLKNIYIFDMPIKDPKMIFINQ